MLYIITLYITHINIDYQNDQTFGVGGIFLWIFLVLIKAEFI